MTQRLSLAALVAAALLVGVAGAQEEFPMLDMIADKVIQKYQQASCEQLWKQKREPKPQNVQDMIQILRTDPQRRAAFLNRVAAPIANKMIECGMIP